MKTILAGLVVLLVTGCASTTVGVSGSRGGVYQSYESSTIWHNGPHPAWAVTINQPFQEAIQ